jgi:hypothetical protein
MGEVKVLEKGGGGAPARLKADEAGVIKIGAAEVKAFEAVGLGALDRLPPEPRDDAERVE